MRRILHRWYSRTYQLLRFLDHRLTPAGKFLWVLFFIALFFGLNTQSSMVFAILTPLGATLILSRLFERPFRPEVSVRRLLPRYAAVGTPLSYRIEIVNRGKKREAGLSVCEETPDPRPDYETWRRNPEPGEEKRNAFDRFMRYYRWEWLIERRRGAQFESSEVPSLMPGETRAVEMSFTPTRRGVIRLSGCRIEHSDVFGLWKRGAVFSTDDVVIALPPVHSIRIPEFCGHRRYQQGGVVVAHKVGDSEEFMQVREYRPGDPLKRIHWPSSARVGSLAVKEFNDEYFARIALILDTFHPAAFSPELEDAVSIAASYLVAGATEEEVIDLLFVGAETVSFSAGRGTGSTERMLEILAGVEPCRDKPFSVLSGLVGERISSFCGAVVVLLALDDERLALLRMLTVAGIEYRVFWVTADAEAAQEQVSATGLSTIRIVPLGHVAEALRTS